jgi:HEAT repeat protein
MTQKKQPINAGELMARLETDPTWVAKRAQRDAERQQRIEEERRTTAPIAADLRAAGIAVDSPWELVSRGEPQPSAIPILLNHFQRPYPAQTREWIARTIGALRASPTWDTLVRFYRSEQDPKAREGLAAALADLADPSRLDELIELVRDRQHGPSRAFLLLPLRRARLAKARETIESLANDPDLKLEIARILKQRDRHARRKRKP